MPGQSRRRAANRCSTATPTLQNLRHSSSWSRTCCVEEVGCKLGPGLGPQEGHWVLICWEDAATQMCDGVMVIHLLLRHTRGAQLTGQALFQYHPHCPARLEAPTAPINPLQQHSSSGSSCTASTSAHRRLARGAAAAAAAAAAEPAPLALQLTSSQLGAQRRLQSQGRVQHNELSDAFCKF